MCVSGDFSKAADAFAHTPERAGQYPERNCACWEDSGGFTVSRIISYHSACQYASRSPKWTTVVGARGSWATLRACLMPLWPRRLVRCSRLLRRMHGGPQRRFGAVSAVCEEGFDRGCIWIRWQRVPPSGVLQEMLEKIGSWVNGAEGKEPTTSSLPSILERQYGANECHFYFHWQRDCHNPSDNNPQ
jgi:hypothetical protein